MESDFSSDTVFPWDPYSHPSSGVCPTARFLSSSPNPYTRYSSSTLGEASANEHDDDDHACFRRAAPSPRPSCYPPASCGLSSLVSSGDALPPPLEESSDVDDYPMSDEEYRALMLAEFGPLAPLPLTLDDQVQATMVPAVDDDVEIQAPALLPVPEEDESRATIADENETKARPDKEERRRKKRKRKDGDIDEIKEMDLSLPRARSKMMATRLLEREHSAPEPTEQAGRTVLWCQCKELPLDATACALHQPARYRSWMLDQDQIPAVGSDDGVVVPRRPTDSRKTVLKYIRWRSRVWMPSRFYVEHHAQQSMEMTL